MSQLSREETEEKVRQYEAFLNERLRTDLRLCLEERDKIYEEQAEFLALRNSINAIKTANLKKGEPLKTKVDLGSNFYCQARIPEPDTIYVDVGLGFFCQMTLDEAVRHTEKRDRELSVRAEELTRESSKLRANIRLVMHGLKELQNLEVEERPRQRDIFA